jgi:uncharacterized protein
MTTRNFDIIMKHNGYTFKSKNIDAIEGKMGLTRLIHAIRMGYVETIQMMIDIGANLEETGLSSKTPLMHAIECRNTRAVNMLLKHGANYNAIDDDGWNVLKYAKKQNYDLQPYINKFN